jgi:hypothetical protein
LLSLCPVKSQEKWLEIPHLFSTFLHHFSTTDRALPHILLKRSIKLKMKPSKKRPWAYYPYSGSDSARRDHVCGSRDDSCWLIGPTRVKSRKRCLRLPLPSASLFGLR